MPEEQSRNIIISRARLEARRAGADAVGAKHVLLALMQNRGEAAADILGACGVTLEAARKALGASDAKEAASADLDEQGDMLPLDSNINNLFQIASQEVDQWKHEAMNSTHLLAALVNSGEVASLLKMQDTDLAIIRRKVSIALKLQKPLLKSSAKAPPPAVEKQPPAPAQDYKAQEGPSLVPADKAGSREKRPSLPAPSLDEPATVTPPILKPPEVKAVRTNMDDWFGPEVNKLIYRANLSASKRASDGADLWDVLTAIIEDDGCFAHRVLGDLVDIKRLREDLTQADRQRFAAVDLKTILVKAFEEAQCFQGVPVASDNLLVATLCYTVENTTLFPQYQNATHIRQKTITLASALLDNSERPSIVEDDEPAEDGPNNDCSITERAVRAIHFAIEEAIELRHAQVSKWHLILGLIREARLSEVQFVSNRELPFENLSDEFKILARLTNEYRQCVLQSNENDQYKLSINPEVADLLRLARRAAKGLQDSTVDINHIGLALLTDTDSTVRDLLTSSQMSTTSVERRLRMCLLWQKSQAEHPKTSIDLLSLETNFDKGLALSAEHAATFNDRKKHTNAYESALKYARAECVQLLQHTVCIEHLILGILRLQSGAAAEMLNSIGIELEETRQTTKRMEPRGITRSAKHSPKFSARAEQILERADRWKEELKHTHRSPEHILLAIASEHSGIASLACDYLALDGPSIQSILLQTKSRWEPKD